MPRQSEKPERKRQPEVAIREDTARQRAEIAAPLGVTGDLVAAQVADFEEPPADLVQALGLVGTRVIVGADVALHLGWDGTRIAHRGHTILGSLIVRPVEGDRFLVKGKVIAGAYKSLSIPVGQFVAD